LIRIEDTTYRSGEAGVTFIYGPGPSPIRNGECLNFYGAYDFIWIRDRMLGADDVPPSERSAASRFLRGDCNDDGLVELVDAVCTLDGLFGEGGIGCRAALNVNGDEQVDLSDPISLLTHLFLGGPAPVAPFPDCGPGELDTDDELGCEKPLENCQQ
jgi:hypothetical protein